MKICLFVALIAVMIVQCYTQDAAQPGDDHHKGGSHQPNTTQNETSVGDEETDDLPRTIYITHGRKAQKGSHPYLCELQKRTYGGRPWTFTCGSAIYNNLTVLTAAHCMKSARRRHIRVVCGSYRRGVKDKYETIRRARSFVVHPRYVHSHVAGYSNDLAMIRLKTPLKFNSRVNTLPVPDMSVRIPSQCVLMGWGRTTEIKDLSVGRTETVHISRKTNEINVTMVPTKRCKKDWDSKTIDATKICFDADRGTPCRGDSGSPAVCGNYMVGVSSWGTATCTARRPSVFTSLPYYKTWIEANAAYTQP